MATKAKLTVAVPLDEKNGQVKRRAFGNVGNKNVNTESGAKHLRINEKDRIEIHHNYTTHGKKSDPEKTTETKTSLKAAKPAQSHLPVRSKLSRVSQLTSYIPRLLAPVLQGDARVLALSSAVDELSINPPEGVTDIDSNADVFSCPAYSRDIMKYLRTMEHESASMEPCAGSEVTPMIRSVLVDWLIQVQNHIPLHQGTLHLGVAMFDQFINRHHIALGRVQLLGITCLFISSKVEERYCPSIEKLIHLTDDTYTYEQVVHMEIVILRILNFQLNIPTALVYIGRYLDVTTRNQRVENLCQYMLDLGLGDVHIVRFVGSKKAAASLCMARAIMLNAGERLDQLDDTTPWTRAHEYYTDYTECDLKPVIVRYAKLLLRAPKSRFQGARTKYASASQHGAISQWTGLANVDFLHVMTETKPSAIESPNID